MTYVGLVLHAGPPFLQALNQQLSQPAHSAYGVIDSPIVPVAEHLQPQQLTLEKIPLQQSESDFTET